MAGEVVLAAYRPKVGREGAVLALLRRHVPTLRRLGLATDRPTLLLRDPSEGVLLEIFEWRDGDAARRAHDLPEVATLWDALAAEAEFVAPASLSALARPFPHFTPVEAPST